MEIKHVIINGKYMAERMQGIVRYAREIVNELDKIIDENMKVTLAIPSNSHDVPPFDNIEVVKLGKNKGIIWEQTDLRRYIKKHKSSICLNLCNVAPLFVQPGITAVLDVMYKANPTHYTTLHNRFSRMWHCLQYQYISRHEYKILTLSRFSKDEIEKYYPRSVGKTEIIPCSWQHVLTYKESDEWHEKYPFLKENDYFFSLATLAKNKNGKWIIEIAKNNPEKVFAIAGNKYETEYDEIPSNVFMLKYVSDADACSLIRHCRAFIFPSIYEGFGLPPLEALALGAEVVASNCTSLPEVLGHSVHYINPYDVSVDLDELLKQPVESKDKVLEKYGWDRSAKRLYDIIAEAEHNFTECY